LKEFLVNITVLYDGYCVLCRQSLKTIRFLDWLHRVEPLDLQNHSLVQAHYPNLNHDALMGAIHVVTPDQRVLAGFFALRYLARFLPALWSVLPLLYLPGMNYLGPKVYDWIARRRYAINRLFGVPTCEDGYCKIH
jgi:predicted DCC family thiol-disulfide oxidoreductase YuxK